MPYGIDFHCQHDTEAIHCFAFYFVQFIVKASKYTRQRRHQSHLIAGMKQYDEFKALASKEKAVQGVFGGGAGSHASRQGMRR